MSLGIACPTCESTTSEVVDSRGFPDFVRRRRRCLKCSGRFSTYERKLARVGTIERVNKIVQAYLDAHGGDENGFDFGPHERRLARKIARLLHRGEKGLE